MSIDYAWAYDLGPVGNKRGDPRCGRPVRKEMDQRLGTLQSTISLTHLSPTQTTGQRRVRMPHRRISPRRRQA